MNKSLHTRSRDTHRGNRLHMSHEDIAREMIAEAESFVTRVISKEDKMRIEATRLVNKYWNRKLDAKETAQRQREVIAWFVTCGKINKNLAYTDKASHGVIPICDEIDANKLNDVIDSCNEFVSQFQQFRIRKNHKTGDFNMVDTLDNIDLEKHGVFMYLNGALVTPKPKAIETAHDKKVIASKATHQLGDIL